MKFCYVDESGTGNEPIAVMVGIVVDAQRMRITKDHWQEFLNTLSRMVGREVTEIHTRDFYSGKSIWQSLDGNLRANIISAVFDWLRDRKHQVVYASVDKERYREQVTSGLIPKEINTVWRYMAFHLMLSMQKANQRVRLNKGNTVFIFDNEHWEQKRFIDLSGVIPTIILEDLDGD
jgi:hypothetical protein